MAKTFLDHLILIEEVTTELDVYDIDPSEKEEILALVHQTTHQHILNVILNHLPKNHHESFLTKFQAAPHDPELLSFLKKEIKADIESEIRSEASRIKKDLLAEIKKSSR